MPHKFHLYLIDKLSNNVINYIVCRMHNELLVHFSGHGLNNEAFDERTVLDHSNTKLVCYSDPHCMPIVKPIKVLLKIGFVIIFSRVIRVFLKFSMPKARINQIFKRSSQQIYNVTIFFLFFMSLYGLLGVQVGTATMT